jgi:hypothetical protein
MRLYPGTFGDFCGGPWQISCSFDHPRAGMTKKIGLFLGANREKMGPAFGLSFITGMQLPGLHLCQIL